MTEEQLQSALAALVRLGMIEMVRDAENIVRFSIIEMINHHGEVGLAHSRVRSKGRYG